MRFEGTFFNRGMIMEWSGSLASIPAGWLLCNGSNSTPDLRNRFVAGAGDSYNPGDNGGAATHRHGFGYNHNHNIGAGTDISAGGDFSNYIESKSLTGNTDYENTLPPYYALAYIMKV